MPHPRKQTNKNEVERTEADNPALQRLCNILRRRPFQWDNLIPAYIASLDNLNAADIDAIFGVALTQITSSFYSISLIAPTYSQSYTDYWKFLKAMYQQFAEKMTWSDDCTFIKLAKELSKQGKCITFKSIEGVISAIALHDINDAFFILLNVYAPSAFILNLIKQRVNEIDLSEVIKPSCFQDPASLTLTQYVIINGDCNYLISLREQGVSLQTILSIALAKMCIMPELFAHFADEIDFSSEIGKKVRENIFAFAKLHYIISLKQRCNFFIDIQLSSLYSRPDIIFYLFLDGSVSDEAIKVFYANLPQQLNRGLLKLFYDIYEDKSGVIEKTACSKHLSTITLFNALASEMLPELKLLILGYIKNVKSITAAHYAVLSEKYHAAIAPISRQYPRLSVSESDPPAATYLQLRLAQLILRREQLFVCKTTQQEHEFELEGVLGICDKSAVFAYADVESKFITQSMMAQLFYNARQDEHTSKAIVESAKGYLMILDVFHDLRRKKSWWFRADTIAKEMVEDTNSFIECCRLFLNPDQINELNTFIQERSQFATNLQDSARIMGFVNHKDDKISWSFEVFKKGQSNRVKVSVGPLLKLDLSSRRP